MHLLDFINTHSNWEELLSAAPYNLIIKKLDNYFICNYNMIASDFTYTEVQEARGSIFKWNESSQKAAYVCHPFHKFFNYGEELAASINWASAKVTEKIDGSLMKMWWDETWHLSTNGTIDAFAAPVSDFGLTFGDLFEKALGRSVSEFGKGLNQKYTYCFELTSPESQVIIGYDTAIWFLTIFVTDSGQEIFEVPQFEGVRYPQRYNLSCLDDVLAVVESMDKTHEGVVVADQCSNRIKVKSPEYLVAAHLRNNGAISKKKIIEYIYNGQIDDFLGYCPQYQQIVTDIKESINKLISTINNEYKEIMSQGSYETKKDFALAVKNYKWKAYHFIKYEHKDEKYDAAAWLAERTSQQIIDWIGE